LVNNETPQSTDCGVSLAVGAVLHMLVVSAAFIQHQRNWAEPTKQRGVVQTDYGCILVDTSLTDCGRVNAVGK